MLEHNFNSLDDDFITLWSKFIMSGPSQELSKQIETLAELGQINAVQSWYLIKSESMHNDVIDKKVNDYERYLGSSQLGANEYLAIANRCKSRGDTYRSDIYLLKAIEMLDEMTCKTEDAVVGQRWLEVSHERMTDTNPNVLAAFKKNVVVARKELMRRYKKGEKSPTLAYALGKNIIFFKDMVITTGKTVEAGKKILTSLSERNLSSNLQKQIQKKEGFVWIKHEELGHGDAEPGYRIID